MRYGLVRQHHALYPARWMCEALSVSERGYRAWSKRKPSQRSQDDKRLLIDIRASHEKSERTYGSPRVFKDLREEGHKTSEKRVARLMRENDIVAIQRRRFRITTQSGHSLPVYPNLLDRDFNVEAPNRVWLGDITYIRTEEGWLYLAALLDLYSRRVVGWNTAERIDRWLTLTALQGALRTREPGPGLIHHSDRGSQYAAYEYQRCLERAQATTSMSRKGDCWDNAPMESFFSTLKRERVYRRRYWTREEANADLADYIDRFYNRTRRHSQLGGLSPARFEARMNHT